MFINIHRPIVFITLFLLNSFVIFGQKNTSDSSSFYNEVKTYVNPVLPGDHPDPTSLKIGEDFYHCGSSFHFTPYLPIYHSKDLVHWEVISRVMYPSKSDFVPTVPPGEYGRELSPIFVDRSGYIFQQTTNISSKQIHFLKF